MWQSRRFSWGPCGGRCRAQLFATKERYRCGLPLRVLIGPKAPLDCIKGSWLSEARPEGIKALNFPLHFIHTRRGGPPASFDFHCTLQVPVLYKKGGPIGAALLRYSPLSGS